MKVLVTGGFGYLGSHLAQYFKDRGHDVSIFVRGINPNLIEWSKQFNLIIGDFLNEDSVNDMCNGVDWVIHTAALNEVYCRVKSKEALLINSYGTRLLLENAVKHNVKKFLYFSTFHVYGVPTVELITEETKVNPMNDYSITHYVAETYCNQIYNQDGLEIAIARITNGYGAPIHKSINRWTLVLNDFCKTAYEKEKIILMSQGTQERDFVGIADIIKGSEILLSNDLNQFTNKVFNIGGENNISIYRLANLVAEVYKDYFRKDIEIEISRNAKPSDKLKQFTVRIDKIKNIGYAPNTEIKNEIKGIFKVLAG